MNKRAYALEVGMAAALIGSECFERVLKYCNKRGEGSADAFSLISAWAILFVDKHINTDWEKMLLRKKNPLSWDGAVLQAVERNMKIMGA